MRRLGNFLSCLFFIGLFYVVLFAVYEPARLWPIKLIYKDDQPAKGADAIILLMGDVVDRTPLVAGLWKDGYANKIIFVQSELHELNRFGFMATDADITRRYLLEKLAVPEDALIFVADAAASSTREEAEAIFQTIEEKLPDAKRLILSTSWYHSRRADWMFQRLNKGRWRIESSPSPLRPRWYEEERSFIAVYNEYLKVPYYLAKYGLL